MDQEPKPPDRDNSPPSGGLRRRAQSSGIPNRRQATEITGRQRSKSSLPNIKSQSIGEKLQSQVTNQAQTFTFEPIVVPSLIPKRRSNVVRVVQPKKAPSPLSPRVKDVSSWNLAHAFSADEDFEPIEIIGNIPGQFEDKKINPTSLAFDPTGSKLAVGTNNGDIIFLSLDQNEAELAVSVKGQINAFEPKFNPLVPNSDAKAICAVKWFPFTKCSPSILVSNSNTIKLFRVIENSETITGKLLGTFPDRHLEFSIHSVSFNSDGETFLSADDLKVYLWNIQHQDAICVLDLQPEDMNDLEDAIVCTTFHPTNCNLINYGMSSGAVRMSDLREGLKCSPVPTKVFEATNDPLRAFGWISYFEGSATRSCGLEWSRDGKYLASREYLQVKVWDIRKTNQPVNLWDVGSHLHNKLPDLIEDDLVLDRFNCSWSHSRHIVSGGYNNQFYFFNTQNGVKTTHSLSTYSSLIEPIDISAYPYSNSTLRMSEWHPKQNIVALASKQNIFLFNSGK